MKKILSNKNVQAIIAIVILLWIAGLLQDGFFK